MSGFWGIFRPDGGQVDMEAFNQMCKASERDGFDGMETHVEDGIAMGHLMLRVSPESQYDKQPLKSDCGNYLLVGHFRLDYRDELGDKLGLTQSELEKTPDSRLAMMAYIKWKEKCVHHLEGDWVFCLYESIRNKLFILKDSIGVSALFYFTFNEQYYFSTSLDVFINNTNFNLKFDFVELHRLKLRMLPSNLGRTIIKDVYCLKNGHAVSIDSDKKLVEVNYFNKIHDLRLEYSHILDYILDFKILFFLAVKSRMLKDNSIGIFLSSGLDSTATTCMLSKQLPFTKSKLFSFTSFPYYLKNIPQKYHSKVDESPLVDAFSKSFPEINFSFLNFENEKLSALFSNSNVIDYFDPRLHQNTFWIHGILREAKSKKIKRVFNGQMGNFTLTWAGANLNFELFKSFKFKSLYKNLKQISVLENKTILSIIKVDILKKIFYFLKPLNSFETPSCFLEVSTILMSKSKYNLLKKESRRKLKNNLISNSLSSRVNSVTYSMDYLSIKWYLQSHNYSLESVDPTIDKRFLNYCLRIPNYLFNYKGEKKYIFRIAFQKLLPDLILNQKNKKSQSVDIGDRIIRDDHFFELLNKVAQGLKDHPYIKLNDSIFTQFEKMSSSRIYYKKQLIANEILMELSLTNFLFENLNMFPNFEKKVYNGNNFPRSLDKA